MHFIFPCVKIITFTLCCPKPTKKKRQVIEVQGSHETYITQKLA